MGRRYNAFSYTMGGRYARDLYGGLIKSHGKISEQTAAVKTKKPWYRGQRVYEMLKIVTDTLDNNIYLEIWRYGVYYYSPWGLFRCANTFWKHRSPDLPWKNARTDSRRKDQKAVTSWTRALQQIIKNCFKHHGVEYLLTDAQVDASGMTLITIHFEDFLDVQTPFGCLIDHITVTNITT